MLSNNLNLMPYVFKTPANHLIDTYRELNILQLFCLILIRDVFNVKNVPNVSGRLVETLRSFGLTPP